MSKYSALERELLRAFQFPGDKDKALSLLPKVSDPRTIKSIHGSGFLQYAVSRGWPDLVEHLIERYNFDPYIEDEDKRTPLYWAAYNGNHDIVEYLVREHGANPLKKDKYGHTPLDYSYGKSKKFLKKHISMYNSFRANDVIKNGMREASGSMKVARILMHGAPRVGKTSTKRLILDQDPISKQDSTQLMEDPVRAISTGRMISIDETHLEELDEEKMFEMLRRDIYEATRSQKEILVRQAYDNNGDFQQNNSDLPEQHHSDTDSSGSDSDSKTTWKNPKHPIHTTTTTTTSSATNSGTQSNYRRRPISEQDSICIDHDDTEQNRSHVLKTIASDLDSTDQYMPSLFHCHHIHLVDSGGQPQFSNLLPLILQSQSHHHIVVIRLDEKLHDKPPNRFQVNGVVKELNESLTLTNYQLIERVCQLAKCSGPDSRVIVIGTHLDQESQDEPLSKKNEMLKPLQKKYQYNMVHTDTGKAIFAVNTMSTGDERLNYARELQKVILEAPVFQGEDSDKGIPMPIRWMVFEMELNHRSKSTGVLNTEEIEEVAKDLGIKDPSKPLSLFKQLAIYYHYPAVLPGKIFTSVAPISSGLSTIVESSFPQDGSGTVDKDREKLRNTGKLSKAFLKKLAPQLQDSKVFSTDDFLKLLKYLRIIFEIDNITYFIPSLLPVETPAPDMSIYHPQPLFCFWLDEEEEPRVLYQSFFHALVVDLLRKHKVKLSKQSKHTQTTFVLDLELEPELEVTLYLVNKNFWLEVFADSSTDVNDGQLICEIIQDSSRAIMEQLELTKLGDLQYGIDCSRKCGKDYPHLSKCTNRTRNVFKCLETGRRWKETDDERLFWFQGMLADGVRGKMQQKPEARELFYLLRNKSSRWDDIARALSISFNDIDGLQRNMILDNDGRLDCILHKWEEIAPEAVTWENFTRILRTKLEYNEVAEQLQMKLNRKH